MDDSIPAHQAKGLQSALHSAQAQLAECRAGALQTAHDLGERVKELGCLYQVSSLLHRSASLPEIMQGIVDALVPAYQFPEITSARISFDGQRYATPRFRESPWRQAAALVVNDTSVGMLEVFYQEARPAAGEGPFLTEERHLIDAIAEMVGRHLHRHQVQASLRESEAKYRTLVEKLYAGIWLMDSDYNTTFVNARAAELLGYAAEEMLGRSVFSFVDPRHHATGRQYLALARTGVRSIQELEFLRKDGGRVWTRVSTTPLFDGQDRYQGALAGVVDISDRKHAEAVLTESEERFRRAATELETIYWWTPVGLAVLDTELRFMRVNRRLAEMNGVPAEAHIGRSIFDVAPAIAPKAEQISRRIAETGQPALDVELHANSPTEAGTARYWNTQWLPLKDSDGEVWGINLVVEEITERRHWEESLYRREQEFEALAERSPDIIARLDRDWRFVYVNQAVEKVTGESRGWFIGRVIDDLPVSPQNRALRKRAVNDVFELRMEQTLEHAVDTPGGTRYFHAHMVPEFGRDGAVKSVLVVDRDITELKRVQHALEQLTLHDPLTGVANRRYLEQFITREWRRGVRHRYTIALIMIDIDHFKAYNDHFGHPQGDECLRQVAHALEMHLHRPTDLMVRYGGEEFLVVLPETGLPEARQMAETMREAVAAIGFPHPCSVALVVTASFGVVAAAATSCTFDALLAAADRALYRAKQGGRNRVEGADTVPP